MYAARELGGDKPRPYDKKGVISSMLPMMTGRGGACPRPTRERNDAGYVKIKP